LTGSHFTIPARVMSCRYGAAKKMRKNRQIPPAPLQMRNFRQASARSPLHAGFRRFSL
jgi:hypothetical protein